MSAAQKVQHKIHASFLVFGDSSIHKKKKKKIMQTTTRIKEIEFDNLTAATVHLSLTSLNS